MFKPTWIILLAMLGTVVAGSFLSTLFMVGMYLLRDQPTIRFPDDLGVFFMLCFTLSGMFSVLAFVPTVILYGIIGRRGGYRYRVWLHAALAIILGVSGCLSLLYYFSISARDAYDLSLYYLLAIYTAVFGGLSWMLEKIFLQEPGKHKDL